MSQDPSPLGHAATPPDSTSPRAGSHRMEVAMPRRTRPTRRGAPPRMAGGAPRYQGPPPVHRTCPFCTETDFEDDADFEHHQARCMDLS